MNNIFYRSQHSFLAFISPRSFKLPSITASNKNVYVESLRGLAILLVVFGHIIGSHSTGGMRVSDDSIFRYLYFSLEYIRMPLFTVISGWVYANKPILNLNREKFIKGKVRRLLLPMFVISTLLFLMRIVTPGTNTTPELSLLGYNLIFPYDVYWYLYSLFVIFLVISVLDNQLWFHTLKGWAATLAVSFLALIVSETYFQNIPNFFSFKGAIYLFPFFIIGIGINRFNEVLQDNRFLIGLLIVFVAGVILQQMSWFGYFPMQQKASLLGMTVGLSGVLLLFRLKFKNALLVWIGSYAYGIFLFHVFFTGGTRIVMLKLGVENLWAILIVGMFTSILIPILLETLINRSKVLRLVFLGLRKNEK